MNQRNGSTATAEDPHATATLDQEQPQDGANQSEVQPKEEEPQQTEGKTPDGKETPPPQAEKPKPTDKAKPETAPESDPVAAAIERLRSDGPKTDDKKPTSAKTQPAPKAGEVAPTNGAKTESTTEDGEDAPLQGEDDPNDPLNGWTPQEKKHTKGAVKQRFRELHSKVQELAPDAEVGKEWSALIQAKQLTPDIDTLDDDQIAWSLRAQGAAVRAVQAVHRGITPAAKDLEIIDQLRAGIAEVDKAIGRRAPPTDPHSLADAFTGQIPEDLKEAAELAGLSEKETRILAALRSHKPVTTPPPQPVTPAPGAPTAPPQQRRTESAPSPEQDEARQIAEAYWAKQTNQGIATTFKLKAEQIPAFFDQNITPILGKKLMETYPGKQPGKVFQAMLPDLRHKFVMDAVTEHQARQRPTPTPQTTTTHTPLRAGGGSPANPGAPVDVVAAAIDRLRND